eukprot:scaffold8047_cov138-Skeletonema_marinoi.AAC.3
MVFPTKKVTASAPTNGPPSTVDPIDNGSGLVGLLFAASQVETKPEAKEAATAAGTEIQGAKAKAPSAVVAIDSIGFASKEEESSSSGGKGKAEEEDSFSKYDPENPSSSLDADAPNTKSFPQILTEILSTPECQSIAHWLPDGFSFIIADKQRLSDEILPKYFRQALLNSFVRKLNRWGFRRIKSRCKGEESSFAHINFIRDKPWLCLKMRCESKPSYHKASSAKNRKKAQKAAIKVVNIPANVDVAASSRAPPSFVAVGGGGGTVNASNRDFVPACLPTTSTLSTSYMTTANATAIGPPTTALAADVANTIRERERPFLASFRPEHPQQQQRIFWERQFLIAHMRQDYHAQVQAELQRLHEMSSINDSYVQRFMMAQYERDVLHRNIFYRGKGR